jgi:hypothetical protein
VSVYFADRIGVEVEAIFGKYKQKFKSESVVFNLTQTGNYTTEMSKIDVPVLLKLGKLFYFEVGPQFTFISKVVEKSDAGSIDNTSSYASGQTYGVIGFGLGLGIPKIVQFEGGLRLGYGFSDLNGSPPAYSRRLSSAFWGVKLMAVHKF